jgi:hypothetical protein
MSVREQLGDLVNNSLFIASRGLSRCLNIHARAVRYWLAEGTLHRLGNVAHSA